MIRQSTDIRVSFCITCKGRLHHLRQTLPINIESNKDFAGAEFVLLNYSSPDDLDDWVKSEMIQEIASGKLVYFKASGYEYYLSSHAKNVAHRLARGSVVCNLDADNFLGAGFAKYLDDLFSNNENIFVRPKGKTGIGIYGRIAIRKTHFESLGGYDEGMQSGWGHDDTDLAWRAKAFGLRQIAIPSDSPYTKVLLHDDQERMRFAKTDSKESSWLEHKSLSLKNIESGKLIANSNIRWGVAKVQRNFSEELELC